MKFSREHLLLYAVTDQSFGSGEVLLGKIEEALLGGATMVQLREKNLDEKELIREAVRVKELCGKYPVPLIIKDCKREEDENSIVHSRQ